MGALSGLMTQPALLSIYSTFSPDEPRTNFEWTAEQTACGHQVAALQPSALICSRMWVIHIAHPHSNFSQFTPQKVSQRGTCVPCSDSILSKRDQQNPEHPELPLPSMELQRGCGAKQPSLSDGEHLLLLVMEGRNYLADFSFENFINF